MDIASIITDTTAKRVPRPLNCFMTYRLEKQRDILQQCPGTNHRDISKITAKWWKEMSAVEKEPYRIKAYNAKFEHEQKYPNYKFNPKKKEKKTRAYKKRSDDTYSLQDIEQKQKLYTLYNQGHIKSQPITTITEVNEPTVKEDICCATCYSSSRTCFSKSNFTNKRNSTESSTSTTSTTTSYTTYYDYTATTGSYRTSRCYGPCENQPYSPFRVPAIQPAGDYYLVPTSSTTMGVPFPSLIRASYSPPISPTFYYNH
ncbi:high mobility group box domain-containing protein [Thamnidium elegans]|nr:high mobility group box domain-containing protein [Thamnidium elegans]